MHTVFINDCALRFIHVYNQKELRLAEGHELYAENDMTIGDLILKLESTKSQHDCFYLSENPDVSWKIFISHCLLIEAAGGLVRNKTGNYLIILRNKKWDLPKGKIEYDETPEEAAFREVEEECGVGKLSIVQKLPQTFHTYSLNNKRIVKKSHWFLMETGSDVPLVPQEEEGIEEADWMDENRIRTQVLNNTYGSIAELLRVHFRWN